MAQSDILLAKLQDCEDSNGVFNPNGEDCTCGTYNEYMLLHGEYKSAFNAEHSTATANAGGATTTKSKDDIALGYIGAAGGFIQQATPFLGILGGWLAPNKDQPQSGTPKVAKDPKTGKEIKTMMVKTMHRTTQCFM
jgi:hypothetical protein